MCPESELISKAQQGDQQAFSDLALAYRKNITGLAYRMIGDLHEAEDIAQNVFIRAYIALPNFVPTHEGALKSWLLTITSRLCIDYSRKHRFRKFYDQIDPYQDLILADQSTSIPEIIIEQEERHLLQNALLRLPPNYRMAISLKYIAELDYQEIAGIMKIPLGTVGTWIRRGLEQLRSELKMKEVNTNEKLAVRTV